MYVQIPAGQDSGRDLCGACYIPMVSERFSTTSPTALMALSAARLISRFLVPDMGHTQGGACRQSHAHAGDKLVLCHGFTPPFLVRLYSSLKNGKMRC